MPSCQRHPKSVGVPLLRGLSSPRVVGTDAQNRAAQIEFGCARLEEHQVEGVQDIFKVQCQFDEAGVMLRCTKGFEV